MCSLTQLHLSAGCWYVSHNVDPLFVATCLCGASAHPCIWYTTSSVFCCSYVFDVVRATVPNINLDDVFTVSYQHLLALQS